MLSGATVGIKSHLKVHIASVHEGKTFKCDRCPTIFRYADVIVHRLLLSALKEQDWWSNTEEKGEIDQMTNTQLTDLCDHINDRNKAAQLAQRQSQLLFQTLYFRNKEPDDPRCIVEAVIFRIRSNGFLVYVPSYALKGPVYLQVNIGGKLVLRRSCVPE